MVYTTKLMLKTAEEIYDEVKNSGKITAQENILNKLKSIVAKDRERIINTAKPVTFEKLPFRLRLFFMWEILRRPNKFIITFMNSTFIMFLSLVNEEECSLLIDKENEH